MPESPPVAGFSRREVLRLLAGSVVSIGALAGCRPSARTGQSSHSTQGGTSADGSMATSAVRAAGGKSAAAADERRDAVVGRAAANERALIAAYDDAMAHFPELLANLKPLRDDHARHLDGLVPGASQSLTPSPTPAPSSAAITATASSPALSSSGAPASSPAHANALAHLEGLEHAAAAARLDDLAGVPGSLARLVASIGACEAAHETFLKAMT